MAETNTILAVSDFDPAGGSGLSADVKTFASFRLFSQGIVTAVVTGDAKRTRSIHAVPSQEIQNQLASLPEKSSAGALKVGVLVNSDQVRDVVRVCAFLPAQPERFHAGDDGAQGFLPRFRESEVRPSAGKRHEQKSQEGNRRFSGWGGPPGDRHLDPL